MPITHASYTGLVDAGDYAAAHVGDSLGGFNVQDYGAIGNGTADDTAEVQAAIDAAVAAGGGVVNLPAGTYKITAALTTGAMTGVTVQGVGRDVSIIRQATANLPIIHINTEDTHDNRLLDLTLEYTSEQTTSGAVALLLSFAGAGTGAYFWTMRNIIIRNAYTGVGIGGSGSIPWWSSVFDDMELLRMHKRGFYFVSPTGIGMPSLRLRNIRMFNDPTIQTAPEWAIRGTGTEMAVYGLDVEGWKDTIIRIDGGEVFEAHLVHVENHKITADGCNLFVFGDGPATLTDVAITANQNVSGQSVATSLISAYDGSTLEASHFNLTLDNTTGSAPNFVNIQTATKAVVLSDIQTDGTLAVTIPHSDAAVVSRVTMLTNAYAVRQRNGTAAQRPTAANAGAGALYYNTDTPGLETSSGSAWAAAGGGGAPTTVDYLVGTADGGLSAEIVVGTSPGGELGGTWASPTVDAVHSGSAHVRNLFVKNTDTGNVGTGEDDLWSVTIAAGQLATDGDVIEFEVGGACTFGNADTATIKAYFAGSAIYDSASRGSDNNLTFILDVRIIRVSSTAVRAYGRFAIGAALANNVSGNFIVPTLTDLSGLTLSGTNILKLTAACSAAGNDQVVAKYGTVKFWAAP